MVCQRCVNDRRPSTVRRAVPTGVRCGVIPMDPDEGSDECYEHTRRQSTKRPDSSTSNVRSAHGLIPLPHRYTGSRPPGVRRSWRLVTGTRHPRVRTLQSVVAGTGSTSKRTCPSITQCVWLRAPTVGWGACQTVLSGLRYRAILARLKHRAERAVPNSGTQSPVSDACSICSTRVRRPSVVLYRVLHA
jgi:hypothetical protein